MLLSLNMSNAQRELDSMSYDNSQDINFFMKIKNNTKLQTYSTFSENVVRIGDTLILGAPTSSETSSRTVGGSYGDRGRVGAAKTRSTTTKTYEFVQMGRPAGFGSVMAAMGGEASIMASNSFKNTKVIVTEMKTYHRGSKKKPMYVVMVLGEINGRAFGANKYLSVMDTELALESGEVLLNKNNEKFFWNVETSSICKDKLKTRRFLKGLVKQPLYHQVSKFEEIPNFKDFYKNNPLVLKVPDNSGSRGFKKFKRPR